MYKKDKTHFGYKKVNREEKKKHVDNVFSSVAENYDLMNDAMSLGMHRIWKRLLVELSSIKEGDNVLDIASGTGDIPKIISREIKDVNILMTDINYKMLKIGRDRSIDEGFSNNCFACLLNGESLPFRSQSFDLITIGFGLRNFSEKNKGLKEMRRCLKKNAKLLILEFSKPKNNLITKLYDWYSFNILPNIGKFLANDEKSYLYLSESIRMHPDQDELKNRILEAGFSDCKYYNLLNGIVSIHVCYA